MKKSYLFLFAAGFVISAILYRVSAVLCLAFIIYAFLHVPFGPLDWYLIYKLYKKLRR